MFHMPVHILVRSCYFVYLVILTVWGHSQAGLEISGFMLYFSQRYYAVRAIWTFWKLALMSYVCIYQCYVLLQNVLLLLCVQTIVLCAVKRLHPWPTCALERKMEGHCRSLGHFWGMSDTTHHVTTSQAISSLMPQPTTNLIPLIY